MHPGLGAALKKLQADGATSALLAGFERAFLRVASGESGLIAESEIEPVGSLPTAADAAHHTASGERALAQTAVIKLNGGLGTSMGLDRAKSLLPVKDGLTFLDIIARQILHLRQFCGAPLPLLLMNSYNTEADTLRALAAYPALSEQAAPLSFRQNRIPRLLADTLLPVEWPADPSKEWCPPGHGDLYAALFGSGIAARLLAAGIRYAFVSNADNLGAGLDVGLLGYFADSGAPFMMEVTARTAADRKGGHLARKKGGGYILRESAQCPSEEAHFFQDITRHRFFNTNNLWLDLLALSHFIERHGGPPDLPVMVNRKTVDPKDPSTPAVLQLETAMGAAIGALPGAIAIEVPRSRFSPVKTTDDLLGLWSDAYALSLDHRLELVPARNGIPPAIKLDTAHYKNWSDFAARFPDGAPSLVACESLKVVGDIRFGKNVVIRGSVTVVNRQPAQAFLSDRILENISAEL
ncbi:MAG: UTP--glucose-1-phosphate uridylyltransferase [Kiritimatiellae bacterium]|nr:UTP--glucose-1-phosphate uridylyltransferase [Kiritimatiellia bacterium]MDW8458164.1 UTP--glucose-1-phosphate uridylyltransferase [Verrucomicrobiota bacterium]